MRESLTAGWHQRLLSIALTVSLAGHATVLGAQLLLRWAGVWSSSGRPAKLIYDREPVHSTSAWTREDTLQPQARLKELMRSMTVTIPSASGGALGAGMGRMDLPLGMTTRELASAGTASLSSDWGGTWGGSGVWAKAADLTDVSAAAQGNPILLSYFGAIREQIQETANTQVWVPAGAPGAGIVYVGFVIGSTGDLQSATVMNERSTAPAQLCAVALNIVKASSPFLPFPPSFKEPSKAVVVPIEFAVGPS